MSIPASKTVSASLARPTRRKPFPSLVNAPCRARSFSGRPKYVFQHAHTEDSDDDSYHGPSVDELNKGAFSYRRMKLALGHFEVTSDDILSWGKR